jgi:methyltransferase-like protein 6
MCVSIIHNGVQQAQSTMSHMADFKRMKLTRDTQRNWDLFYKRNATNFFKDRHWTKQEFVELCDDIQFEVGGGACTRRRVRRLQTVHVLLEAGCGVGNLLFPFLLEHTNWTAYACDFSPRAVDFVKVRQHTVRRTSQTHEYFSPERITAFECDLTEQDATNTRCLHAHTPSACVDLCTLVFVLSAIHPDKMRAAVQNVYHVRPHSHSCLCVRRCSNQAQVFLCETTACIHGRMIQSRIT